MKRLNIILLVVGIFFLVGTGEIVALDLEGKIQNNVYVENIELSKLTKEEAKNKILDIIDKNIILTLNINNEEADKLNLNDIGIVYFVDDAVNKAYSVGRNGSIFSNLKAKAKLDLGEKEIIKLGYIYDKDKLKQYLLSLENKFNQAPIDAQINISGDNISISEEEYGNKIDKEKLGKNIIQSIVKFTSNDIDIPVVSLKPKYTKEYLSSVDTILGKYETHFNGSKTNRVNNIKVAAGATSEVIVNPSEEFSFNSHVQNEHVLSKFKNAPIIVNGEIKQGLGGGICQVSTTIYNATLYSGLEITRVRNHSIPSAYVPKGRDATVSSGETDFRFKNKFKTPIFIFNKVEDNRIVSTIYGNKEDKRDIKVITEIVKTIPNGKKEELTVNLNEGEKKIKQKGRLGYKVSTFRVYKGESIDREFISESYYPPFDQIILNGTKKRDMYYNQIYNNLELK